MALRSVAAPGPSTGAMGVPSSTVGTGEGETLGVVTVFAVGDGDCAAVPVGTAAAAVVAEGWIVEEGEDGAADGEAMGGDVDDGVETSCGVAEEVDCWLLAGVAG